MRRRTFLKSSSLTALGVTFGCSRRQAPVPPHLQAFASLYATDPQAAALAWFRQARFGLFMHYGLYSLLGRGEWVMLREAIPLAEYEPLRDRFRAERFDADFITDLALEAGMTYINLTAKHHDGFCLFTTAQHESRGERLRTLAGA